MPVQESPTLQSYDAGGDLSANQFRFVLVAADGNVDQCGDGLFAAGIQQDNDAVAVGESVQVQTAGRSKVIASAGTENAGDLIASDSVGRAKLAASGDFVLGMCRSDAAAAGETIDMDFAHGHVIA